MSRISVIIPTYNRSHLIPRAVASAFSGGTDVEVVVVDNGATDDTPQVCRGLSKIRYVRIERNTKLGMARNAGIEASSGEFIAFLDDDDLRIPGSLDRQAESLKADSAAGFAWGPVLVGDTENCNPTGDIMPAECYEGDIFWKLIERPFICVPSVMVPRRILDEIGVFDPRFPGVEDWDLWLRISERFPTLVSDEPVAIYRAASLTSNQMSSNAREVCLMALRVQAHALTFPRAAKASLQKRKALRKSFVNRTSDQLIRIASDAMALGLPLVARENLLTALRIDAVRSIRPTTLRLLASSYAA